MATSPKKHVLITFGRSFLTLNLARLMSAAGHRVTVVDSIPIGVTRFSRAADAFYTVPPPKFEPVAYCRRLVEIVTEDDQTTNPGAVFAFSKLASQADLVVGPVDLRQLIPLLP